MNLSTKNNNLLLTRANSGKTTYQLGYEVQLLMFLSVVGFLAIGPSSTEVADKNGADVGKNRTTEFTIAISHAHIQLQADEKVIPCRSLTEALQEILREYSESNKSAGPYKVILAPDADVFSQVPAWYKLVRGTLPEQIVVNVSIP